MDHILFWNAHGAGGKSFKSDISDIVSMNKISVLIICEPRVQSSSHIDDLLNLGFNEVEVVEASGFSGGIWILWNSNSITIEPILSTTQAITVKVLNVGGQPWLLSAIYASTYSHIRNSLWEHLDMISTNYDFPWFLTGDFNEILSPSEKKGGSSFGRVAGFKRWVNMCARIDLGFQGPIFTCTNNTVKESLVRCLCNDNWRLLFPEAKVLHLSRMSSDHCPLLTRLFPHCSLPRINPPFRFHTMWMQHEAYADLFNATWNSTAGDLLSKFHTLADTLKDWNKTIFGNIFFSKKGDFLLEFVAYKRPYALMNLLFSPNLKLSCIMNTKL